MAEMFDLYDEELRPLGMQIERGEPIPRGKYHIVVTILPVSFDNKILITRRSFQKTYGGLWEVTTGAVVAGESPVDGAVRELVEETGLHALPQAMDHRGRLIYKGGTHSHIVMFYLWRAAFDERSIVLQPGETEAARLVYAGEIERMAKSGEFIPFLYQRLKAFYPDIFGEKMP